MQKCSSHNFLYALHWVSFVRCCFNDGGGKYCYILMASLLQHHGIGSAVVKRHFAIIHKFIHFGGDRLAHTGLQSGYSMSRWCQQYVLLQGPKFFRKILHCIDIAMFVAQEEKRSGQRVLQNLDDV